MQEKMVGNGRGMLILYAFLGLQLFVVVESHGSWQNKALKYSALLFRDFQEVTRTEAGEIPRASSSPYGKMFLTH
jgi:hypothetical protein